MARSTLEDNPYERAKIEYSKMHQPTVTKVDSFDEPEEDPDDDEEEDIEDEEIRDEAGMTESEHLARRKVDRTQPYLIDDIEYSEGAPHHDKVSLYYYILDDVLCEGSEEIIDDIDNTVGYDALNALDMQTTVWVRNERLAIDYEVISLRSSYAETVHGLRQEAAMTPRERYMKQKQRREKDGRE